MTRLAVLRMGSVHVVYAKEPNEPCVIPLRSTEAFSDAQMKLLAAASPMNPVMVEADIGEWEGSAFHADIHTIEAKPKKSFLDPPKRRRTIHVVKQHKRMLSL